MKTREAFTFLTVRKMKTREAFTFLTVSQKSDDFVKEWCIFLIGSKNDDSVREWYNFKRKMTIPCNSGNILATNGGPGLGAFYGNFKTQKRRFRMRVGAV